MSACCSPGDFDDIFSPAQARSDARSYRDKGLDAEAARIADAVRHRTKGGFTVLEIGGGIGALQIELLRDGASSATNVELSRSYEDVARELLVEAGVAERVERRVGDVLADPSSVAPADAVILQRVVCCYLHAEGLCVSRRSERAACSCSRSLSTDGGHARRSASRTCGRAYGDGSSAPTYIPRTSSLPRRLARVSPLPSAASVSYGRCSYSLATRSR